MQDKKDKFDESFDFPGSTPSSKELIGGVFFLFFIALIVSGALYLSKNNQLQKSEEVSVTESRAKNVYDIKTVEGLKMDTDGDGLLDEAERYYGTNVNKTDTDADGYGDFEEINSGFNPRGEGKLMMEKWEERKELKKEGVLESLDTKKIVEKKVLDQKNINDLIASSKDFIANFLSLRSIVSLFVKLLFLFLTVIIFGSILRFILRKFFDIEVEIEKALSIAGLQTLSFKLLSFVGTIAAFFVADPFLKIVILGFFLALSLYVYHRILNYFLHTTALKNAGIIIVTGIVMFLLGLVLTILMGILLVPLLLLSTSIF